MVNGGRRYTPINVVASQLTQTEIRDNTQVFANQYDDYVRLDFRVAYKVQTNKITQEWGVDIQNLTNRDNIFQQTYNASTNEVRTTYQTGLLPIGIYRITF